MLKMLKQNIKRLIGNVNSRSCDEKNTQLQQVAIANQYALMKKMMSPREMPSLSEVGFKVYSQFEEDGMLLYIFSVIGTTNKQVVEICAGDGSECMATNLIVNHGWNGLLFDGDIDNVKRGGKFFGSNRSTFLHPPKFSHAWLTRDNVDHLIAESDFSGEIDLLSLDIDGIDYYIMEAISVIKPRVIICEIQSVVPGNLSLTIPYIANFSRTDSPHPDYMGVSLLAMKKLLNKRGYRLIGGHRFGFNVIFMLDQVGEDYFPEVNVESVLNCGYTKLRRETVWKEVRNLPWTEI